MQQQRGVMAPVATNISNGRNGSKTVRIVERERVATLAGSADFTIQQTLKINPALPSFLPWLSTMAQLYEKYRVKSIRVMYHNLCGTSTAGNVLMSFDPDVLDTAPADAIAFSQSTRYIDGAPWRCLTLNIPGSNQALFTRSAGAPTNSDLKTYDYGQIHIATEAMADDNTVGYIEIAYDFEFMERQPAPTTGGGLYSFRPSVYVGVPDPTQVVTFSHKENQWGLQEISFDGVLPLKPLVDDIGVSTFNGAITLPPGSYFVNVSFPGVKRSFANQTNNQPDVPSNLPPVDNQSGMANKYADAILGSYKRTTAGNEALPVFEFVDSAGQPVDSVGFADLTGVCLRARFTFNVEAGEVNGRVLEGSGTFTTYMRPAPQGLGLWPTGVITKIGAA